MTGPRLDALDPVDMPQAPPLARLLEARPDLADIALASRVELAVSAVVTAPTSPPTHAVMNGVAACGVGAPWPAHVVTPTLELAVASLFAGNIECGACAERIATLSGAIVCRPRS